MEKKLLQISFGIMVVLLVIFSLMILFNSNKRHSSITISDKDIILMIGEKYQLSIKQDNDNLFWESSDENVVSIDSITGEIVGISEGTATIRVSLLENLNEYDNCIVNVKNDSGITISDSVLNLSVGESFGISVVFDGNYSLDKEITWKSDNTNIATVNYDGIITAKSAGKTIISAIVNNKSLTCEVTVNESQIEIISAKFNENNLVLEVGDKKKLDIDIEPSNATIKSISFDSNNKDVVAVDNNGNVLAIGPGKTIVLAKINNDRVVRCNITVNNKEYITTPSATPSVSPITPSATPSITPSVSPTITPSVTPSITPSVSPTITPSATPSKIDDQITIEYITTNYTGSKIGTTAYSKSGLSVSLTYYSDSVCKNAINPIKAGSYYAIGRTLGNSTYNKAETSCTKAVTIKKLNDQITINFKSVNYTGDLITTTATAKSGLPVNLLYYSDSSCRVTSNNSDFLVSPGVYYAIGKTAGNDMYDSATSSCTKAVEIKGTYATSIVLNKRALSLNIGSTYNLVATISPSNAIDKTVTWSSSNNNIATVNSNGVVTGKAVGNVTITASTSNGKTASVSVAVIGSELVTSYESSTLNYYVEKPNWTYIVTHIWVKDAYNQMKVAITPSQDSNSLLPRQILVGSQLIRNEVDTNNYQNKGLVAINASAMCSTEFNENAPSHWFGTAAIPYVVNNGQVIRDSLDEKLEVGKYNVIYGLTKNNILKSYNYSVTKKGIINNPSNVRNSITNDGVKYTFGFRPILVNNSTIKIEDNDSNNQKNIRQVLCQIDNNNFIIITSTVNMFERNYGLSHMDTAKMSTEMGCKTTFNLDGGGSTSYFYKYNDNDIKNIGTGSKITPGYGERGLSDMLYFVEK